MMRDIKLYGLLYVSEGKERHVNLDSNQNNALAVYVANAITLARSAEAAGMDFSLVTNQRDQIVRLLAQQGGEALVKVRDYAFKLDVPNGIPFRSAHFKLELLEAFGSGAFGDLVGLIDLDVVVMRPVQLPEGALWAYDISDQVIPAYGRARIAADLARLLDRSTVEPRWFGGEFIIGSADYFAQLSVHISLLWPRYLSELRSFHHIGDEMVVSAALLLLAESGVPVRDAGVEQVVARWWSTRTLAPLAALDDVIDRAILHLPADKRLLADAASLPFERAGFLARYRSYAARQRRVAQLKNVIDVLRFRPALSLPRLA
jgi:hypothetical protein